MMYSEIKFNGVRRWYLNRLEDAAVRVSDAIRDCVIFLCVKVADGEVERMLVGGTAFFVAVASEADPDKDYNYLVTAKHNIEKAKEYGNLWLRMNTVVGAEYIEVEANRWIYPEDEAVDVAVVSIAPDHRFFNYTVVPPEMFATDTIVGARRIGIGDELMTVGLHVHRRGRRRNLPIVRTGIIACMGDENEPLQDERSGLDYTAHLAELRSIGGLSGSPVFVMLGRGRVPDNELKDKNYKGYLFGLIRGHYRDWTPVVDHTSRELKELNEGIAIVTPIQEVLKVLYGEELVKWRRKGDREILNKKTAAQDSGFEGVKLEPPGEGFTRESFEEALRRSSLKTSEPVSEQEKE